MTGPGRNLGIASGDWKNNEPFQGNQPESLPRKSAYRHSINHGSRNDQSDGEFTGV